MRAQLGLGPPPEKEAAPATGDRQGQLGELLRSENVDETEPPRKITEIDPFAALLSHRLCAAAKARARLVQLRDGDPLGELVANRHTIRIVDVLALRDGERLRQRGRRR
jgi:hypothetical protein